MEFIAIMFCIFATMLSFFLLQSLFKFLASGHRKVPLPPGTMGWPYIGETFQLYSQNPNVFFASKVKKLVLMTILDFLDFPLGILEISLKMFV